MEMEALYLPGIVWVVLCQLGTELEAGTLFSRYCYLGTVPGKWIYLRLPYTGTVSHSPNPDMNNVAVDPVVCAGLAVGLGYDMHLPEWEL